VIGGSWLRAAVDRLAADGFVAYPTETVWGLGACADRPAAIERLLKWKRRPSDAAMSILVPSADAAEELGCSFGESARNLAAAFWPGPLTLVVACDRRYSSGVVGESGTLGLRCSSHPVARALAVELARAGLGPLTSTSMNRSGEAPARDWAAAERLVAEGAGSGPEEPLLVGAEGADAGGGAPSSVVDCTRETPEIVRIGAIEARRLEEIWGGSPRLQGSDTRETRR